MSKSVEFFRNSILACAIVFTLGPVAPARAEPLADGAKDTSVSGGLAERLRARDATRDMALTLRRIAMAVDANDYGEAAEAYADYRAELAEASADLKTAEPYSLFNPAVRTAHFAALNKLADLAR